jgi:hypothetical protein
LVHKDGQQINPGGIGENLTLIIPECLVSVQGAIIRDLDYDPPFALDGNSVGMNPPTLHIFQSENLTLMILHLLFIAAQGPSHILDISS